MILPIPQHGPRQKLTKLYNCEHKIPRRFTQAHKNYNKAHKLMIKLAMHSNICLAFNRNPDSSCSNDYDVPCKFAQATRSSRPFLGSLSSSVFEWRTSTGSEPFSLLICFNATKFVWLSVFTLIETICLKNLFKITARECKKPTSG